MSYRARRPACYRPRDPRGSPFYRVVQDHVSDFEFSLKHDQGKDVPDPHTADAFRAFLECGILRFGAARYHCADCGQDLFVALGRLLRYCARPALSPKRLRYDPKENVVLYEVEGQGKKKRVLRLEPVEFLRRVALLKPPPRKNLVRYHGALAPNAPMRPLIADVAERYSRKKLTRGTKTFEKLGAKIAGAASRAWAALISRIYEVDPLQCPKCGGRMELMAVIVEVDEVTRLLNYFDLPTGFPKTLPPRSPPEPEADESPDEESQLDPRVDLYEGIDHLPVDN